MEKCIVSHWQQLDYTSVPSNRIDAHWLASSSFTALGPPPNQALVDSLRTEWCSLSALKQKADKANKETPHHYTDVPVLHLLKYC